MKSNFYQSIKFDTFVGYKILTKASHYKTMLQMIANFSYHLRQIIVAKVCVGRCEDAFV